MLDSTGDRADPRGEARLEESGVLARLAREWRLFNALRKPPTTSWCIFPSIRAGRGSRVRWVRVTRCADLPVSPALKKKLSHLVHSLLTRGATGWKSISTRSGESVSSRAKTSAGSCSCRAKRRSAAVEVCCRRVSLPEPSFTSTQGRAGNSSAGRRACSGTRRRAGQARRAHRAHRSTR